MSHPRPRRAVRARLAALSIVALCVLVGSGSALADGDPASDVLVSQRLFVPYDMAVTHQTEVLDALLRAAATAGFPIRVALIDSRADLGTVTSLWRNPRAYSQYLGTELSLSFSGQVAVVMPDGIGVYHGSVRPTPAEEGAVAKLPPPGSGPRLVTGAIAAVERLSAAAGHPVTRSGIRVTAPGTAAGEGGATTEWVALAIGAALIAAAWGASLRAQPLRLRR